MTTHVLQQPYILKRIFMYLSASDVDTVYDVCRLFREHAKWVHLPSAFMAAHEKERFALCNEIWDFMVEHFQAPCYYLAFVCWDISWRDLLRLCCVKEYMRGVEYFLVKHNIGWENAGELVRTTIQEGVGCQAALFILRNAPFSAEDLRVFLHDACSYGKVAVVELVLSLPRFDLESDEFCARRYVLILFLPSVRRAYFDVVRMLLADARIKPILEDGWRWNLIEVLKHVGYIGGRDDARTMAQIILDGVRRPLGLSADELADFGHVCPLAAPVFLRDSRFAHGLYGILKGLLDHISNEEEEDCRDHIVTLYELLSDESFERALKTDDIINQLLHETIDDLDDTILRKLVFHRLFVPTNEVLFDLMQSPHRDMLDNIIQTHGYDINKSGLVLWLAARDEEHCLDISLQHHCTDPTYDDCIALRTAAILGHDRCLKLLLAHRLVPKDSAFVNSIHSLRNRNKK